MSEGTAVAMQGLQKRLGWVEMVKKCRF